MPAAAARRRPAPPAAGLFVKIRGWFTTDDGDCEAERADLAAARAEAALLRAAAAEPDPRRLHAALHDLVEAGGDSSSFLLEADGDAWEPLLTACAGVPDPLPNGLPRPASLPDRADRRGRGWLVPLPSPETPRLWLLGGPLPDRGEFAKGRRLAEILGAAVDRAFSAERTAARVDRALAMQTAMLAAHEAAGAAGDAADGLSRVLTALSGHAGATHAALLATAPQVRRLAAVGPTESAPVEVVRLAHEHRLAGLGEPGPAEFGPDDLKAAGVRSLVGRAVRVPVAGRVPAALLLTRSDAADFAPHHAEIAAWAGRFLGELLPRVSATAAVRRKASRDPLTGLANRGTFEDRLEELALDARSGGDDLTLLMCDLDHFKAVNDAHGHQVGDAVLVAAADAFRAVLADCRREDRALPARFGGEELCVLLAGFGRAGADRVAERLRAAVARIGGESGGRLPDVTVSIGCAALGAGTGPDDAGTPGDLVAAADAALYAAKRGGRDRVVWADGGAARAPATPGGVRRSSDARVEARVAGPLASA